MAYDPGPTYSARGAIRVDERGHIHFVAGERRELNARRPADADKLRSELAWVKAEGGLAAVEAIRGFAYQANRVQALLETARIEEQIVLTGLAVGLPVVELDAPSIRRELCGQSFP